MQRVKIELRQHEDLGDPERAEGDQRGADEDLRDALAPRFSSMRNRDRAVAAAAALLVAALEPRLEDGKVEREARAAERL